LERVILFTKNYQDNQTKDKRSGMYQTGTARELHPTFSCRNLWGKKTTWNNVVVNLRIILK